MRTKIVKRYFCDHCARGGLRSDAMQRHETRCFRNPNRHCEICADAALNQKPMDKLIAAFPDPKDLQALRDLTEGCPACILATIIQARHMMTVGGVDGFDREFEMDVPVMVDFKYKEELQAFNAEDNRKHLGWAKEY